MIPPLSLPPLRLASTLIALSLGACATTDVGQQCEDSPPVPVGDEPVGGEDPVVEVVRVGRDQACESFQCLQHQGLSAYCTETCVYLDTPDTPACTTDRECVGGAKCAPDGVCRQDDCPAGVACRNVHETGPLADELYCVRRTCEQNLDCANLGVMECVEHACYDQCLKRAADETCEIHAMVCEESIRFFNSGEVECACADNAENLACNDDQLRCSLPNALAPWPDGAVTRRRFCLARDRHTEAVAPVMP